MFQGVGRVQFCSKSLLHPGLDAEKKLTNQFLQSKQAKQILQGQPALSSAVNHPCTFKRNCSLEYNSFQAGFVLNVTVSCKPREVGRHLTIRILENYTHIYICIIRSTRPLCSTTHSLNQSKREVYQCFQHVQNRTSNSILLSVFSYNVRGRN